MTSIKDDFDFDNIHRSDEELQKVRVGKLKPHNGQITLHEYDSHWPELSTREARRNHSVLGKKGG